MKINTEMIEGFDQMTAEEKVSAMLSLEIEDGESEIAKLKQQLSKANSEAAGFKKSLREKQTDEEKKAEEHAAYVASLEEKLKNAENAMRLSSLSASFREIGYSEEQAKSAAQSFIEGDCDSFFQNAKKHIEDHDKNLKAEFMKGSPRPSTGASDYKSKKDIMSIKDREERLKAIEENHTLFEQK